MKWIVSLWYSEELQHSHILILDNLEVFFGILVSKIINRSI